MSGRSEDSTASKSGLLALPQKLFECVAEFIHATDLLSLRLTSKETSKKTVGTFENVHLSETTFIISYPDCLEVALKNAKHETFGPAMKKITFYVDEVSWRGTCLEHSPEVDLECCCPPDCEWRKADKARNSVISKTRMRDMMKRTYNY